MKQKKQKLLLHCCCAPCSSAIIEELSNYFDITLYYYNPCITDKMEYDKRARELIRLVNEMHVPVKVVIADFDTLPFYEFAIGQECIPEGGSRCKACYANRLSQTAIYAKNNGFRYFSTTLTISPYKDSAVINSIGTNLGGIYGVMYMPFDFGYLYVRSLLLCEQYRLYQQQYCGCDYSK